jgi:energy-converting hydrogenase A subunit P
LTLTKENVVAWDDEKCNRCKVCVEVCPQQAVAFDEKGDRIILCDLCAGKPLCIQWCPENVISV